MSIKFFHSTSDGKFEFSREELERLLNDVYADVEPTNVYYNEQVDGPVYCTDTDSIGKIILEEIKEN